MLKIKIDAGHVDGWNTGIDPRYKEGTRMFLLAQYEQDEFDKYNDVEVTLSRSLKTNPSLYERCKAAAGYDLLLSDHTNANSNPDSNGVHIYEALDRAQAEISHKLGKTIADTMGTSYRLLTRKDSNGANYYGILRYGVLFGIKIPLIIEHGYHTNAAQCKWLLNDSNLKILAVNKVRCIAEHYGLQLKASAPLVYYRLKSKGDGVKKLQEDLTRLGYPLDNDGVFGILTEAAVIAYQLANGLKGDGSAGPLTLGKIAEQIAILDAKPRLTEAPDGKQYIVQAGAFKIKEYADARAAQIIAKDFNAIVKLVNE